MYRVKKNKLNEIIFERLLQEFFFNKIISNCNFASAASILELQLRSNNFNIKF